MYMQGRNEVAAALLAAGADVDAPDSHKMTPLHKAAVQVSTRVQGQSLEHCIHKCIAPLPYAACAGPLGRPCEFQKCS